MAFKEAYLKRLIRRAWTCTPVISELGRLILVGCEFKANLGYIASACFKEANDRDWGGRVMLSF